MRLGAWMLWRCMWARGSPRSRNGVICGGDHPTVARLRVLLAAALWSQSKWGAPHPTVLHAMRDPCESRLHCYARCMCRCRASCCVCPGADRPTVLLAARPTSGQWRKADSLWLSAIVLLALRREGKADSVAGGVGFGVSVNPGHVWDGVSERGVPPLAHNPWRLTYI